MGTTSYSSGKIEAASEWRDLRRKNFWILIGEIVKHLFTLVLAFSFTLPFVWMFTSALKDDTQVFSVPPIWFPDPAHWENFWKSWTSQNFTLYFANTVFRYAIPATVGTIVSSALVAYGFARIRWRMRGYFFAICLATMMVPGQVTLVPLFIIFRRLGWIDTYLPLVVPSWFGAPYFIFLLRQFFLTIPQALSDSAKIDGASEFRIFFSIILPLAKPALAVVGLFRMMWAWNDYFGPLVYVNDRARWPLALGIEHLRNAAYEVGHTRMAYPYLMAVSTLVTIPILVIFFLAQRTFIEGISLTGLKG